MAGFESTNLWQSSLGERPDDEHADARSRLRNAYLLVRERAAVLASEIPLVLPEFTVHDVTHLDALWEMADLIVSDSHELNAAEGFVLGCAFLIHDLGMGLAAYPGGMGDLHMHPAWPDMIAASIEQVTGEPATLDQMTEPPPEALKLATELALRERHAEQAESLGTIAWTSRLGDRYHLIEDAGLRETFGPLVGRLAHSHWWDCRQVADEFGTIGGIVELPSGWDVDGLLLACILRLSDAAHLDSRRAPSFTMVLRGPSGLAHEHWTFQRHLQRVRREEDRLVYTSIHRFKVAESPAWWLCLDSLRMVDHELRAVDSLLADLGKTRFAARSVYGVEDPQRLAKVVPTDGWTPVDASVKVGDVTGLVQKLGGSELYGDRPELALHELIANGADAIRALTALDAEHPQAPIQIRLVETVDGWYLEVRDYGIGMSEQVMTGALLDFGKSFWGSPLMREEFPNLLSSGYRSTGRYGIGFFSVFMLGAEVHVRSRRYDRGLDETNVLEFNSGLETRPLLRRALHHERLAQGGTLVRVRLSENPFTDTGVFSKLRYEDITSLLDLVKWLAPASPVDLEVQSGEEARQLAVGADDWMTCDGGELFDRLYSVRHAGSRSWYEHARALFLERSRLVRDEEGCAVGRLALLDIGLHSWLGADGVVTVGGFRAADVSSCCGLLLGSATRAARDTAIPLAGSSSARDWMLEQVALVDTADLTPLSRVELAEIVTTFGIDSADLPIAQVRGRLVNQSELEAWAGSRDQVRLAQFSTLQAKEMEDGSIVHVAPRGRFEFVDVQLDEDVLLVSELFVRYEQAMWPPIISETITELDSARGAFWHHYGYRMTGKVIRTVCRAWGIGIAELLAKATMGPAYRDFADRTQIGKSTEGWIVKDHIAIVLDRSVST